MTVPSGPFEPDADWGITGNDGSIPGQASNTQDSVVAALKARQKTSPGWKKATADVWEGLRRGTAGNPVSLPLATLEALGNPLLAPFGLDDEFSDVLSLITEVAGVVGTPVRALSQIMDFLQKIVGQQQSEIANLRAQINALRLSKEPTVNPAGGWDPCIDASGFDTPLIGTLTPTGYGTLTSSGLAVAHYSASPPEDRNRVGMLVKTKRIGQTGLHFCADDAMTNYLRLLLDVTGTGTDTVSLVTGTGPNSGISPRREYQMRIPTNSFWEIAYEPYDEDSETSNTFHVFLGGQPIVPLQLPDEGNLVIHGPNNLRWGVLINGLGHPTRRGFEVTDVSFGNWQTGAPQ